MKGQKKQIPVFYDIIYSELRHHKKMKIEILDIYIHFFVIINI
jgi:hypothetical protein